MTTTELLFGLLAIIIFLGIFAFAAFTIFINTRKNEAMLTAQIEGSKIRRSEHVTTMRYDDIKKVISDLISIYSSDIVVVKGLRGKKPDELSVLLDETIVSVCTDVWSSMSEELKIAAMFYVTEKHLKTTIKNEVRLNLIARLSI